MPKHTSNYFNLNSENTENISLQCIDFNSNCQDSSITNENKNGKIENKNGEIENKNDKVEIEKIKATSSPSGKVLIDKSGLYQYKDLGEGRGLLIGTDVYRDASDYANAFPKGVSDCPEDLIIPRTLKDQKGVTKPVEVIGQAAFCSCACYLSCSTKGKTRRLTLTKQVKVIKYYGLGWMHELEHFSIEPGSVLETVEKWGLHWIGGNTATIDPSRRITLVLPSTLSSVYEHGIFDCSIFDTIIYCGPYALTNNSDLEVNVASIIVKVTSQYPSGKNIFGRKADRSSANLVQDDCMRMSGNICHCSTSKNNNSYCWLLLLLTLSWGNEDKESSSILIYELHISNVK